MVTGKGGVGKSLFSHWLARKIAQNGTRTLLAELGDNGHLSTQKTQILPSLWAARWTAEDCLKEYFSYYLPSRKLVDLFFANKVTKTLVGAAPGLRELALLGKVTAGPRKIGPPMQESTLVVDAFSTGHFLALLRAPVGLSKIIPVGPMGTQTKSMIQTMADPKQTAVWVVSRPEKLALTEALELAETLRTEFQMQPRIVLSGVLLLEKAAPLDLSEDDFVAFVTEWDRRTRESIQILQSERIDYYTLPFIFKRSLPDIVDGLIKDAT